MNFLSNLFVFSSPTKKSKKGKSSCKKSQPSKSRKRRSVKKSRKRRSVKKSRSKGKFGFEVLPEHVGKFCCIGKNGCVKINNTTVKCSGNRPWSTEKGCKTTCDFQTKTYDTKTQRRVAKEEKEQAKLEKAIAKASKMKFSGKKKKIDNRTEEEKQAAKEKMARIRSMRK